MWYYIADYQTTKHGLAPALPPKVGFLLMASPGDAPPWGVFGCNSEVPLSANVRQIPEDLSFALAGAKHYPPALALAREDLGKEFKDRRASELEVCRRYAAALREHMAQQPNAPYLFVQATGDEPGYLTRGQFYWVLRYLKGSDAVKWVSSDYFVYENPTSDFAVSQDQLAALLLPHARAV
jgi:hypothetical protein